MFYSKQSFIHYFIVILIILSLNAAGSDERPQAVDNGDGTVFLPDLKITFAKCSQADHLGNNTYNGNGKEDKCDYGLPSTMPFCLNTKDSCFKDIKSGVYSESSPAHQTCRNLKLAGKKWRLPTAEELRNLRKIYRKNKNLFPDLAEN